MFKFKCVNVHHVSPVHFSYSVIQGQYTNISTVTFVSLVASISFQSEISMNTPPAGQRMQV